MRSFIQKQLAGSEEKIAKKRAALEAKANADGGYPSKQMEIGLLYVKGKEGFPLDFKQAEEWLRKAAEHKDYLPAKVELAKLHMDQGNYTDAWLLLRQVRNLQYVSPEHQKWRREAERLTCFLDTPEVFTSKFFTSLAKDSAGNREKNIVKFFMLMAAVSSKEEDSVKANLAWLITGNDPLDDYRKWRESRDQYIKNFRYQTLPLYTSPWYLNMLPPEGQKALQKAMDDRVSAIVLSYFVEYPFPEAMTRAVLLPYLIQGHGTAEQKSLASLSSTASEPGPGTIAVPAPTAPASTPASTPTESYVSTPAMRKGK